MKQKTLADYTNRQLCLPALLAQDASDILFELSCALQRAAVVSDSVLVFNAARAWRASAEEDQLGSTGYALGVGPMVERTAFAVARTRACAWRPDTSPVYLVFLVTVPPTEQRLAPALIHAVQRLVADRAALRDVHAASSGIGIISVFERFAVQPYASSSSRPKLRQERDVVT